MSQGDKISADMRMLELKTITLRTDQSMLTGENEPVIKTCEPIAKKDVIFFKV